MRRAPQNRVAAHQHVPAAADVADYDVDFTAAKYDETGQKLVNAKITVRHNGVLIHENQELPGPTASAPRKEDE